MSSSGSYYPDRGGRGGRNQGNYNQRSSTNPQYRTGSGALQRAAPRDERSDRPAQQHGGKKVCEEYAFRGRCRFHTDCRYSHGLRCIGTKLKAHRDRILSMAIGKTGSGYQMFTVGKDCQLMRWELRPQGNDTAEANDSLAALFPTEATRPSPVQKTIFDVILGTTSPLPSLPTCLFLLDDLLLVALSGGVIQGFEAKSGTQFNVPGHVKDVNSMLITRTPPNASGVLVTGDMSGIINMYRPSLDNLGQPTFTPAQSTKAEYPITRLKHIENTFLLIAGGIGCVGVYDMSTNLWGPVWRSEDASGDGKGVVCLSINKVDTMYLAIFTRGEGLCINQQGALEGRINIPFVPRGEMVTASDWAGDRLVVGFANGFLSSIDLTTLRSDWQLGAHGDQVRRIEAIDDFFVTVSTDASIGVWRLSDGSDNRMPPANNHRGGRR